MKTKEELNTIKEEVEALNNKLAELTDEELAHVTGGAYHFCGLLFCLFCLCKNYAFLYLTTVYLF